DDGRDEAAERRLETDAAPATRRQRRSPSRLLGDEIERSFETRSLAEMIAPKCDRIFARATRELVHARLDGEDSVVRTNAAPEPGDHARRLFPIELDLQVGNVVAHVLRRVDAVGVDAVLKSRR